MKTSILPFIPHAASGARPYSLFAKCVALAALFASSHAVIAQTVWTGATGDWFAGGNWSAGVPGATSDARVNNGGTPQVLAGGAAAQSILVGFDLPDSGNVVASGSGSLSVTNDFAVGYGGSGTLAINNGAVVSDYSGEIGYTIASDSGAHGAATVDGAGSAWIHTYELYVGYGTGTLSITNGGTVSDYFGYLGYFPEFPGRSSGTAVVDGAGSSWTHASSFIVGNSGTGVLNVSNGGAVSNGFGYLGFDFGSDGTATIDGAGSNWTTYGFFYVGDSGDGTLNVTNGGLVNSNDSYAYIAFEAASHSSAVVDGAGSLWNNAHGIYVGFSGEGSLAITGGGSVINGAFANVGFSPGASGTLAVSGAGSSFASAGALSIGGNISGPGGTGLLHVVDGGNAAASVVSVWNTGTLEIGDGGEIDTSTLTIDGTLHATGGTAAVGGDLALTSASTTQSTISAAGAADVVVTGTATLGGQLAIDLAAGVTPGVQYTVLEAAGGLGGSTFAGVTINPPDQGLVPQLSYDANHVYLVLAPIGGGVLTIAPGSVDFGTVPAGITVGPATITLTNTGTDPVDISAIAAAAAPFERSGGDCPTPPFELAPSTSCTLGYTFMPTTIGPQNQSLAVTSNAGTHTISLAGTGIAGVPSTLVMISGSDQSAAVGTPFAAPLMVEVRDDWSNPVPGITVTFAAPGSGASAVLSSTSAITDASGRAAVNATANAQTGSYSVTANGGLGAPVGFALTNVAAVADVGVGIVADRDYARVGELVNYTITLHNAGPNAANGATIASVLSPLLDASAATWICIGPAESGCTPSGEGQLADANLSLPAGGSVSYLLSAPVRLDAVDGSIETDVHGSLAGDPDSANDNASSTMTLVLFRDGFESNSDAEPLQTISFPLAAGDALLFAWPAADGFGLRVALSAEAADIVPTAITREAFRLERFDTGASSWMRAVVANNVGERASAWIPVTAGELLSLFVRNADTAASENTPNTRRLVLTGSTGDAQIPLATAPHSYRVSAMPSLHLAGSTSNP